MLRQPMLYVAVALMTGIMIGSQVETTVEMGVWAVVFCVLFFLAWVGYRWNKWLCDVCLLLSTVTFGIILECWQIQNEQRPLPAGRVSCQAIVVSMPQAHGKVMQSDVEMIGIQGHQLRHPFKARLSFLRDTLSSDSFVTPVMGDGIAFTARLQHPGDGYCARDGSGHFDSRRWLLSQDYRAQALVYSDDWHRVALPLSRLDRVDRVRLRVGKWREGLLAQYRRAGLQGQEYAVVAAMTLGDKSGLTKSLRQVYSRTGTSHVLALSGLHLSILFMILLSTFRLLRLNRWVRYWLVLLVMWSFVVLVGMPVSVVRAAIMLSVGSVALLLHRRSASLSALSLAAVILLVIHPGSLWDVSFQLSFMAVLSLIVVEPMVADVWYPRYRIVSWFWSATRTSVIAQLGTAPLVIYYFGNLSVYFLPANLIVALLSMPLLLLSFFFFLSLPLQTVHLGLVSDVLAQVLSSATWLLNHSLGWLSSLPGAAVDDVSLNEKQVWLYYFALVCFVSAFVYRKRIKKKENG